MELAVVRRIRNGVGANLYNQAVTVAVQLVTVPVLLGAWGAERYGEWLILFAVPAFLSMTDLGFSQSAGNDMTARVARGDRAGALCVFQTLVLLVASVSAGGLLLGYGILWHLPLQDWLRFASMPPDTVRWVLWLLAAEVFIRLLDGPTHAGFRANGEYALHSFLAATVRLMQYAAIWVAALAGGGPMAAAAAFFGVRVVVTPVLAATLLVRHAWLHYGLQQVRPQVLRRLVKPALANIAIPFSQALNLQGLVLVVGAVLGPAAVVVFSTLRTLTRLALQMIRVVSGAMEPEMASAFGSGDHALLGRLFVHSLRAAILLCLVTVGFLWVFGAEILRLWTGGGVEMVPQLFGWLLAAAVAGALWFSPLFVLRAANQHVRVAAASVITSVMSVALAWVLLVLTRDVASAGAALFCTEMVAATYALYSAAHLIKTTLSRAVRLIFAIS